MFHKNDFKSARYFRKNMGNTEMEYSKMIFIFNILIVEK